MKILFANDHFDLFSRGILMIFSSKKYVFYCKIFFLQFNVFASFLFFEKNQNLYLFGILFVFADFCMKRLSEI